MAAATIIAAIVIGTGALIKTIGDVQKAQRQAKEDERKAEQLEELSKPGGYYDQVLESIQSELQDVEADRMASGKMLAISSLQVTRQGAQAAGHITAGAGAGNLAQTGSIEKRKGLVEEAVNIDLAKSRLQYEDQLRGLATRQKAATAEETLIEFKKQAGTEDAAALKSEADWLNTWGVGLSVASGITGLAGGLAGLDYSGLGSKISPVPSNTGTAISSSSGMPNYGISPYITAVSGMPSYLGY